jgi:hypothetical protein
MSRHVAFGGWETVETKEKCGVHGVSVFVCRVGLVAHVYESEIFTSERRPALEPPTVAVPLGEHVAHLKGWHANSFAWDIFRVPGWQCGVEAGL